MNANFRKIRSDAESDASAPIVLPVADDKSSPLMIHRPAVETDFANLPDGSVIETIEDPSDPTKTMLAAYRNGVVQLVESIEYGGQTLVAVQRSRFANFCLPKGTRPYESAQSLIRCACAILRACLDIDAMSTYLLAYFALSTWLAEKLPIAPYVAFVGLPGSGKTTAEKVLARLCRRPVLIENFTLAAIYRMYDDTIPTLFIDETSTAADQRKLLHLLRSGSTPGFKALQKDRSFRCYGPKVVTWIGLPRDPALNSRCLVIPLSESDRTDLKRPDDPDVLAAAEDFQKRCLQFRLEKFNSLTRNAIPKTELLRSRARDLYEALGLAIAEDVQSCIELVYAIDMQAPLNREPLSLKQAAVVGPLFTCCHESKEASAYSISALSTLANLALERQGESLRLTPRGTGEVLTSLGIGNRSRTNQGYLLFNGPELWKKIHSIVKRHLPDSNGTVMYLKFSQTCSLCREIQQENTTSKPTEPPRPQEK